MPNEEMDYRKLFDLIRDNRGISDIWGKVLGMLHEDLGYPDRVLILLCLYFSLTDDGNICIPLDPRVLKLELDRKCNPTGIDARAMIELGINELKGFSGLDGLFKVVGIDGDDWLFSQKFYDAKTIIEKRISILFPGSGRPRYHGCDLVLTSETKKDENQREAVIKGLEGNLIITGGPGTGKTTVAYDIIKNILINLEKGEENIDDWNLFLTAPTGKAKDRLKESILECIERDTGCTDYQAVIGKLKETEPHTIHSLLLKYSKDKPFPEKSIFVIDEASMIDVCLFASFMDAIPDGAIVFILGDKDQLPSIDAGAVLGDVLGQENGFTVELKKSHRTNTEIWKASGFINEGRVSDFFGCRSERLVIRNTGIIDWIKNHFMKGPGADSKAKAADFDYDSADQVFRLTETAKILCAERKGLRGADHINRIAVRTVLGSKPDDYQQFFPGELLMITENNNLLGLSNGDNGVVVRFRGDDAGTLWFMIKKGHESGGEERDGIFSRNGYTYYPLTLIPSESVEVSYAMTIHKSQGSGYNDVLIILPENEDKQLLNRQILYTAITRTKGSATIIASEKVLTRAIEKKDVRYTKIRLI